MFKKLGLLIILIPSLAFCAIDDFKEERMKILSELGLPLPDSGIVLVPRSTFNLSDDELKKGNDELEQMKTKGYIEEPSTRPMEMIHFKQHAQLEMKSFANNINDASTHIRTSIKDLKLGFKFKGVSKGLVSDYIGVVPQGAFHEEGWSGAVQFFESKPIGTCAYAEMNVAASHTAAQIALEDADYTINNKLTLIEVRGDKASGFDYKIRWFDDITFHELECANMKYSKSLMNKIIKLGRQIDTKE